MPRTVDDQVTALVAANLLCVLPSSYATLPTGSHSFVSFGPSRIPFAYRQLRLADDRPRCTAMRQVSVRWQ